MKFERRASLPWLLFGALFVCAWCSLLSGLGGWFMGQDFGRREARAELTTTGNELPPLGVLVTRLDRTGPAAGAGVLRNDTIVAIEGIHVQDARDLREQLQRLQPGKTVRLTVLNDHGQHDALVQLAPHPNDNSRAYLGIYYTARADEPADL